VAEQKLDVKNLDLMLAVAELTFLRQFSFRGAPRCFTAGGPTGEIMKDLLTTEGIEIDPYQ
jgi:hypothetical protein